MCSVYICEHVGVHVHVGMRARYQSTLLKNTENVLPVKSLQNSWRGASKELQV